MANAEPTHERRQKRSFNELHGLIGNLTAPQVIENTSSDFLFGVEAPAKPYISTP